MSKIIKLTSENVKCLKVVEITPQGNVVVIAGNNGAGKSSVLDSIQYALGGEPDTVMPVRVGEEKAKIVLETEEFIVKRTFTAGGGTALVVTNREGQRQASPQALLDKLVGRLSFDPMSFLREKPAQQYATLQKLVGLDFSALEKEREKVFNARTEANRELKGVEVRLRAQEFHSDVPPEEISTASVLLEQAAASAGNARNAAKRVEVKGLQERAGRSANAVVSKRFEVTELKRRLELETAKLASDEAEAGLDEQAVVIAVGALESLVDTDLAPFSSKLAALELQNRRVRENLAIIGLGEAKGILERKSEEATARLENIDAERKRATIAAQYPIKGLSLDLRGYVTFNEIPFGQCSSADQLQISVAMGLALNPKLRVMLVRDGSLLDDESLASLGEIAEQTDAQIWIERVDKGIEGSVVIEDGSVVS